MHSNANVLNASELYLTNGKYDDFYVTSSLAQLKYTFMVTVVNEIQ